MDQLGFPDSSAVKNLPTMQEMWFRPLNWEDLPEEEMAIHSSILARKIPWTEEPGGYSPWDYKESDKTERLSMHLDQLGDSVNLG